MRTYPFGTDPPEPLRPQFPKQDFAPEIAQLLIISWSTVVQLWGRAKGAAKASCGETDSPKGCFWRVRFFFAPQGFQDISGVLRAKLKGAEKKRTLQKNPFGPKCTKTAHRRSLAIFTADEGIARNSAARTIFTRFHRRRNGDFLRGGNRAS